MGFINSCWETLLELAVYSQSLGGFHGSQQPLRLPQHGMGHDVTTTAGLAFTPPGAENGFQCHYPQMVGYEYCGTAGDRSCWIKPSNKNTTYNIHTNYEAISPVGIPREYWLNVSVQAIAPDGYLKLLGQVFNNTYPGPNLQACWGDTVTVHVTNLIPNLGTTVHWHGIRQLHTNQQDGVNGVTQCPIAYRDTYTYTFKIEQYGHTWYHSHYQTQYSDGVMGPLSLYGPSSASKGYDEALPPILVNDWVHENTSVVFREELTGGAPVADGLLLGGKGNFRCADNDPLCCNSCRNNCAKTPEFCCIPNNGCFNRTDPARKQLAGSTFNQTFTPGKRYLLRLVNSSAGSMFIFMIDGHELEIVQTDLVPIQPYTTDSLFIGIGQRYEVVVAAKPKKLSSNDAYWIRTRIATGCGDAQQDDETTGIIRYGANNAATPSTLPNTARVVCEDEDPANLVPVVPWNVTNLQGDIKEYTFTASLSTQTFFGAFRWDLTEYPLFLNYSDPAILNTENETYIHDNFNAMVSYNFSTGYVYLIIDGSNLTNIDKQNVPVAHPIHLHGHDFVILAQTNQTFNASAPLPLPDLTNPPRRDVALLYAGGYLALAFKPDNPGIWLVHCHIAWHASSGLALQILERQDEILPTIGSLAATKNTCSRWDQMNLRFQQDDSGI